MSKTKKRKTKLKDSLVDPTRSAPYTEGGRLPLTEKKLVPVTVAVDTPLYDEIKSLSEKFINPSTLKPYGISSVSRICLELGIEALKTVTEADLLYYVPHSKKGSVGRFPMNDAVKITILIQKEHVRSINSIIAGLHMDSKIIGTTTVVRWLLRETVGDVRIKDLYTHVPESHKIIMEKENLTHRKLLDKYLNSKKTQ